MLVLLVTLLLVVGLALILFVSDSLALVGGGLGLVGSGLGPVIGLGLGLVVGSSLRLDGIVIDIDMEVVALSLVL